MPSNHCEKMGQCKNSWWCAIDYRPDNKDCFEQMTEYDRLISKTPEEMAVFLASMNNVNIIFTKADWLDWLRSPVEVEG